jgi:hypothetical protein
LTNTRIEEIRLIGQFKTLIILLALASVALGLGGCQKTETKQQKQSLPLVGNPVSPLPTPNAQTSPIKR